MKILGVDPGCKGGLALIAPGGVRLFDMPSLSLRKGKHLRSVIDLQGLKSIILDTMPDLAVIELVGGMTGQSAVASFNFGKAAAAPEDMVVALTSARVELVAPRVWKRGVGVTHGDKKDAEFARANALYPDYAHTWAARPGNGNYDRRSGRAEALLIAHYGLLKFAPEMNLDVLG